MPIAPGRLGGRGLVVWSGDLERGAGGEPPE